MWSCIWIIIQKYAWQWKWLQGHKYPTDWLAFADFVVFNWAWVPQHSALLNCWCSWNFPSFTKEGWTRNLHVLWLLWFLAPQCACGLIKLQLVLDNHTQDHVLRSESLGFLYGHYTWKTSCGINLIWNNLKGWSWVLGEIQWLCGTWVCGFSV